MMMDVPGRLPLRRLEGEVERTDAREMDAGREVGLAEEVVMTLYGIVAGVLEVHRKGRAARKDEAAADPAFLLADHVLRRSEEHTSELQSRLHLVCRLL